MYMAPSIPDAILADPFLLVALTIAVRSAVAWQRGLTWPEYRITHRIKCRAFQLLDPVATRYGRPLVRTKGYAPGSPEFVEHIHDPPSTVAKRIKPYFSPHLIATAKRRETHDGLQFAHSQWRQVHGDGLQTEVYLFPAGSGTDVYAHVETVVEDPDGHLTDGQQPGDALGSFDSAYRSEADP